jgi:hypothetical protein
MRCASRSVEGSRRDFRSILRLMSKLVLLLTLMFMLAACGGAPTTKCPDPDPDPNSPCATSHSQTHGMD